MTFCSQESLETEIFPPTHPPGIAASSPEGFNTGRASPLPAFDGVNDPRLPASANRQHPFSSQLFFIVSSIIHTTFTPCPPHPPPLPHSTFVSNPRLPYSITPSLTSSSSPSNLFSFCDQIVVGRICEHVLPETLCHRNTITPPPLLSYPPLIQLILPTKRFTRITTPSSTTSTTTTTTNQQPIQLLHLLSCLDPPLILSREEIS